MRRVVNWKRLLVVIGVFAVLAAATYGVHAVQVRRQADGVKAQAEQAAADPTRLDRAVTLYERYLKLRPKDEAAYRKYTELAFARAREDRGQTRRAVNVAEDLLRKFPDNPAERRKLIDIYMKQGLLTSARQHIEMLFNSPGGEHGRDTELRLMAANCEVGLGDLNKAYAHLEAAMKTGKAPVPVYALALDVLQANTADPERESKIAGHLDTLINQEPFRSSVEARVVAGRFLLTRGEARNARTHILHALNEMPGGESNVEVLLAAAALELDDARAPEKAADALARARGHLEKAFALGPKETRVGLELSTVLARQGDLPAAAGVLRRTADAADPDTDPYFQAIDRLIDLGQADAAAPYIERVAQVPANRILAAYLRGRLAVLKRDWVTARARLEEAAGTLNQPMLRDYHKRAMADLGRCYEVLQNPDRQLQCYRAALADDPNFTPAMIGEAQVLARLGRVKEALPRYRILVNGLKLSGFRPTLVRLELVNALSTPQGARKWASFDESLGPEAERTPEIQLLHAESLAARGQVEEAAKRVEAVLVQHPAYPAAWLTLARVKHGGRVEGALADLDKAEKTAGDSLDLRLSRAALLVGRTRKPTPDEFRRLGAGADRFPTADLPRLWFGLGEAALRAVAVQPDQTAANEMRAVAIDYFRRAADADPLDLVSRQILVDLGIAAGRPDVTEAALVEIAKVEGPNGPLSTLGRIAVRLPGAKGKQAEIAELRAMANAVKAARPGWGRVYVALAQLDELEDRSDAAVENYREAIARGDRPEFVIRRAVELYQLRKRDDLAAALLNSIYTEVPLPDDLERFRAVKDLLARDIPRSERPTIDRIAPADAKDFRLLLLRGSLLAAIRADDDALAAFRLAVERGDGVPDTWTALVGHLVRQGRIDEAKQAVAQAERKLATQPPADPTARANLILALALCHEAVRDMKLAEERFRQATAAAPRELNTNRELVTFLQRSGKHSEADQTLRKLADDSAPDLARWARRHLALTIMSRPDAYTNRHAALALIDRNLATAPDNPDDVKARAVVLTADPATRDQGIKTLLDFAGRFDLTPDEFYLLGRLFFDQGKVAESADYFALAARPRDGMNTEHLSALVRVYLALNKLEPARQAVERLKAIYPRSWEATREEARLLHKMGLAAADKDEGRKLAEQAKQLILDYPGAMTPGMIPNRTGPLLEELGFGTEAEAAYRRLLETSSSPGAHVPLAVFLITQKRTAEAIELARKHDNPGTSVVLTARILSGAIRAKSPGPDLTGQVEVWLKAKLKEYADKPEFAALVGSWAELLDAQARYPEAIAEYRRAVEAGKSDLTVNNLCMLLALHQPEKADEALKLITDLIEVRGPNPVFLDTRAVVYLVKGRPEDAVKNLELALLQRRSPVYLFHLAWAHQLLNRPAFRETTLDEARKAGLTVEMIHPLELPKYRELLGPSAK